MAFKGVGQTFVFSEDVVPTGAFTAAVRVDGYDAYNNMAQEGMFEVHYKNADYPPAPTPPVFLN